MKEQITFNLKKTPDTVDKIEKLSNILSHISMQIQYDDKNDSMIFRYDTKDVNCSITRLAGKKRVHPETFYTVGEVKHLQSSMTGTEIAKLLGLSRATYFRRLKELKNYDDNDLFY